ncbi:MAG: hypothetical protein GY950_26675 [bacterium]|nr:hypothetical protein [bacterium]
MDNKKAKSVIPLVLLLGTACLIELVTSVPAGTRFYYYDVWVHSLSGLSGFVAGFLLF